jgi:hypothetical protein
MNRLGIMRDAAAGRVADDMKIVKEESGVAPEFVTETFPPEVV